MSAATRTIRVDTSSRSYDVVVGSQVLESVGGLAAEATGAQDVFVVTDTNVAPLYLDRVARSLGDAGVYAGSFAMPAGEPNKTFATLGSVCDELARAGLTRDSAVVALGGGVVGDVAGFAAAIYMRGIQVVQVPTTLLAMVDSSVGGKTAVDARMGKNLLGSFLQPSCVLADTDVLGTLDPQVFLDGMGEVVKHAVLADERLFQELALRPLREPGSVDPAELVRTVARNVEIKRDVVAEDERERGLRQTLNLGHTIGHAIEAASGYRLGHGHCVAAGLCCMARATESLGWTEPGVASAIERLVAAQGLPVDTDLPLESLLSQALYDKKRHGDRVNIVVPVRVGRAELRSVTTQELEEILALGCGTAGTGA